MRLSNFRNRQLNHARNVWDRAITILPRANQFWYKYTYMEEMLGNSGGEHSRRHTCQFLRLYKRRRRDLFHVSAVVVKPWTLSGARQVFERWMEWEPEEQAWQSYINFELRYKELDRARHIYERFVMVHPEVRT